MFAKHGHFCLCNVSGHGVNMEAHGEKTKLPPLSTPLTQATLFSLPCPIHSVEAAFASSVPRPGAASRHR